ncbi:MAG: RodZ domain-containing protein [Pseudomonadota bacterium]|nr:RodZ domain-containing protein [Pseudomonadota bacterium]
MSQMSIEFGVGKELRAARLKAELKITDVAEELNLKVEHLTAIEKDSYSELPGNTYVVGFVRSYAKFLGLNDAHLVDRLQQSGLISSLQPSKPTTTMEDVQAPTLSDKKLLMRLVSAGLLVVALVLVFFIFKNMPEDEAEQSIIKEDVVAAKAPESTNQTPSDEPEDASAETKGLTDEEVAAMLAESTTVKPEAEKPVKLVGTKPQDARVMLTAKEDAWYQVYNTKSGRVYQNAVLKKGHSVWVTPGENVVMDLGRPHMMEMTIDGEVYGKAGPSWGGVIKRLNADPTFLIYDFYGEGLNEKSYNRWLSKQEERVAG